MGGRRRGPLRLAAPAIAVALALASCGGSGGPTAPSTGPTTTGQTKPRPTKPVARASGTRLPAPISGEAAVASPGAGVLSIGGVDSSDVSTTGVVSVPADGRPRPAGSLAEPLHDAAATVIGGRTLVFGGGAATTLDSVETLRAGGRASVVGHLPMAASDLSAAAVDDRAYVLGGYDGVSTLADVLETTDGSSFRRIASLPVPLRYGAVAPLDGVIYAFGGELPTGADTDAIQAFDVATGRARVIAHLPAPTSHASAVALGGRIYVLGGRSAGVTTDRIVAFDPSTGRAKAVGRLPYAVQNAAAATSGGTGYLIGGLGATGSTLDSIITVRLVAR